MQKYQGTKNIVKWWLFAGIVLIFFQIMIGGITRLTGSGLSITKWDIVTGSIPPLTGEDWDREFDLYKETPQYEKINQGLSLSEFKFIYFWEYFHRVWARMMGFVFIIPLAFFLVKGYINKPLLKRLGIIFLLAGLVATFGWIMVASGLVDRPWVNAYKLSIHLGLALITFSYLLWTYLLVRGPKTIPAYADVSRVTKIFFALIVFQLFTGALVSGMRAAMVYPSWPDMNGVFIPAILYDKSMWSIDSFLMYDKSSFMPALTQLIHRTTAYLILVLGLYYFYRLLKSGKHFTSMKFNSFLLLLLLITQVSLGILTLINAKGQIPVFYGVAHQSVGILLLSLTVYFLFKNKQVQQLK